MSNLLSIWPSPARRTRRPGSCQPSSAPHGAFPDCHRSSSWFLSRKVFIDLRGFFRPRFFYREPLLANSPAPRGRYGARDVVKRALSSVRLISQGLAQFNMPQHQGTGAPSTGIAGRSAIELGRDVIVRFGSLQWLFAATLDEIAGIRGLGPAKYVQLKAVIELVRRAIVEDIGERDNLS